MEQLVLLLIIGLISLVNWVMQKAAEKREQAKLERAGKREGGRSIYTQPVPRPEVARRPQAPGQDPFKELMDALGLPSDQPPPVVGRRPEPEEEFASLEESAPPPVPPQVAPVQVRRWQPPTIRRPDEKTVRLASAFGKLEEKPAAVYRGSKVRDLLANRDSQRQAVILAEILGTPRGLVSAGGHW